MLAVVVLVPMVVPTWRVEADAWPFVAGSTAFETLYYGLLVWAYGRAELSLIYPLARGVGPILILLFGVFPCGAYLMVITLRAYGFMAGMLIGSLTLIIFGFACGLASAPL